MIMIERNDYALNVFNGDIGLVLPDKENAGALAAWFTAADGYRSIPLSRLSAHSPAFAITVHKSQGSEYREVWLLPPSVEMPPESGAGLNKALLYTAITRARERFVFCGSRSRVSDGLRLECATAQRFARNDDAAFSNEAVARPSESLQTASGAAAGVTQ